MFSRRRKNSKYEINGIFKNIFGGLANDGPTKKNSFKKRFPKLTFLGKTKKVKSFTCTPEKYNSLTSTLYTDVSMGPEVRSILKSANSSLTASAKKKLRFQDAELNETFHSIESDDEYYNNMKQEILSRSTPIKPKRKSLINSDDTLFRNIFLKTDNDSPVLDFSKILNENNSVNQKYVPSNPGKINNSKKYKVNRFNPISRELSCSVAMLKSRPFSETLSMERMSWCST